MMASTSGCYRSTMVSRCRIWARRRSRVQSPWARKWSSTSRSLPMTTARLVGRLARCGDPYGVDDALWPRPRPIRRVWLHAPGTGRLSGTGAELRADRHDPGDPPHELDGRCAVPCGSAGCRPRLYHGWAVVAGDEPRRACGRPGRGVVVRGGDPADAVARRCELCRLLSD